MSQTALISAQSDIHPQPQRRWKPGWLILFYGLVTLALTYPLFWQIGTAVAGFDGRDSFQHVWYQWWLKKALLELGVWPDQVTSLYYPLRVSHPVLALHPYVPLTSLPFTLVFNPLISYNLALLLSFILSGVTGFYLCYYVCRQPGAALVGGLIFAFYPNRFGHAVAGHLLLTTNYLLPLYALSLLMLLHHPSVKRVVWYALVTALLALAQPTHIGYGIIPVFLFLGGGYVLLVHLPARSAFARRLRSLGWATAATVLAMLFFLPFAWPMLRLGQQGDLAYLTPNDLTEHSTDLLAFLLPSPYNPLLTRLKLIPNLSAAIVAGPRDLEEQLAYLGFTALVLSVVAVWKRWRQARLWLGLALTCALLSLGPLLKVGGQVQSITLPYRWLAQWPFFAWSRTPGRLNETVMLGIAVLASIGLAWLLRCLSNTQFRPTRGPLTWLVALLLVFEYVVVFPFPLEARSVPGYYDQLGRERAVGGVLEVPVTGSRRASNYAMYYQTVHQQPLAGGYIERDPPGTVELKEFLNQLISPLPGQAVFNSPTEDERRAILANMGIGRVIAHPSLMTDRAARATADYLPLVLGEPLFVDNELRVYETGLEEETNLSTWTILPDQENWEVVKDGAALRLKKEGYLFIYTSQPGNVNFEFEVAGSPAATELLLRFNEAPLQRYPLTVEGSLTNNPISLQPGFNYFWLSTDPPQDIEFLKIAVEAQESDQ